MYTPLLFIFFVFFVHYTQPLSFRRVTHFFSRLLLLRRHCAPHRSRLLQGIGIRYLEIDFDSCWRASRPAPNNYSDCSHRNPQRAWFKSDEWNGQKSSSPPPHDSPRTSFIFTLRKLISARAQLSTINMYTWCVLLARVRRRERVYRSSCTECERHSIDEIHARGCIFFSSKMRLFFNETNIYAESFYLCNIIHFFVVSFTARYAWSIYAPMSLFRGSRRELRH